MSKKKFAHAFALLALLVIATAPVIFTGLLGFFKGADAEEEYETEVIPVDTVDYDHIMLGDLNGDNEINNADLILMRRYLAGSTVAGMSVTGLVAADVNEDNGINNADLIMVRRHLANSDAGIIEGYHSHNWTTKKIHHDEVGHWETKNKPYIVTITYTGKVVNSKEYNHPTFYDGLKAVGCWDSSYVNYHSDKSMTGANFTSFDFGVSINGLGDIRDAIDEYYDCGSTSSCNKRTIMETTYNSWDELSNDLAFYKSEFGLDLSYAKENCYEKTWVVDKAAYDETIYTCSVCGATK